MRANIQSEPRVGQSDEQLQQSAGRRAQLIQRAKRRRCGREQRAVAGAKITLSVETVMLAARVKIEIGLSLLEHSELFAM